MYNHIKKTSNILKYVLTFIILIFLECLFLVSAAWIPKDYLHNNLVESANFLCEKDVFFYVHSNDKSSRIDRYADSILLNIANNYDENHPFVSVMSSSYYFNININENFNLKTSVMEQPESTVDYSRYWHGSLSIIRPMLIFFNIEQIYIIFALLLTILIISLSLLIGKYIGIGASICFIVSTIMTSIWYVPMSLEYIWTILIMLIASIICIIKLQFYNANFFLFFFVIGNITAYFDFLTTETITLLIPMILIVIYNYLHTQSMIFITELKKIIGYSLSWLTGYGLTWIAKWSLASMILQENVFKTALNQASYRAVGDTGNLSGFAQRMGAEARNLSCIFPFGLIKGNPLLVMLMVTFIIMCVMYLIRKENCPMNILLIIIGFIPYVRYFVLSNHSYLHYFFTYRAQLATIFCVGIMLIYGSDKTFVSKEWSKLWKLKKR